ncbi:hypothetical protein EMIT0111MI5_60369 [Burkholderia sp. IT-111MI5]
MRPRYNTLSNASSFMQSATCVARVSRGALDASNADRNATSSGMFRSLVAACNAGAALQIPYHFFS